MYYALFKERTRVKSVRKSLRNIFNYKTLDTTKAPQPEIVSTDCQQTTTIEHRMEPEAIHLIVVLNKDGAVLVHNAHFL